MHRSRTNIWVLLAALVLGVVLGLLPANAAPTSLFGDGATLHQIGDGGSCAPILGGGPECHESGCPTDSSGCCSTMIDVCCGTGGMVLAALQNLTTPRFRSTWLSVAPSSLPGVHPLAMRRPPRA